MSILNPTGVPSFYLGLDPMGNSGYGNVSDLISADLSTTNQVSMAVEHSILDGNMIIRVQSQLENQFSGDNCYLALYYGRWPSCSSTGKWCRKVPIMFIIIRFVQKQMALPLGCQLHLMMERTHRSYAALVPDPIWNHENLYVVAVISSKWF